MRNLAFAVHGKVLHKLFNVSWLKCLDYFFNTLEVFPFENSYLREFV